MASEIPIKRKDLWGARGNIRLQDWVKAVQKLGLPLTTPNSGTSHKAIRKQGTDLNSPLGLDSFIVNIYEGMSKQANGDAIKCMLSKGKIDEDDLWRALGKLR